jgi:hypothetical protein
MQARDILDQAGVPKERVLIRDYGTPDDVPLEDTAMVDLADGNVFRLGAPCVHGHRGVNGPAKLAFICDDAWEVTLTPRQTGHSLKRLLGLADEAELLRDFESPNDQVIRDDEAVQFADGPVFTCRRVGVIVKVNRQDVRFLKRRVTGLEIKQTAIAQGVKIDVGCVLYRLNPDGSLGPAIRDSEVVVLKHGDAFQCVAPDDNSDR